MPLNVNYDGIGWNADYIASLTKDEFVRQFAATTYGHVESVPNRIKAAETAYNFILGEYRKIHPHIVEKPAAETEEE
jgi:hypothetical protein